MADTVINNPNSAYGYTNKGDTLGSFGFERKTSAAISAGRVVQQASTGTISTALTNGTVATTVGIVPSAIASGGTGRVVTYGPVDSVPCTGAISAGDKVKPSVTTAGSVVVTASPATGECIGYAMTDSASNLTTVFVMRMGLQ